MLPQRFMRVGSNLFWLVANRVFRMALGVIVLGAIGRYLGPSQFGTLNYAIGISALFAAVASLGFDGIVIRELVRQPGRTSTILGTAWVMRMIGAVFGIGLVSLTGLLTGDADVSWRLLLVVALVYFPTSLEVIDLWFQKNIQSKYTVQAKGVAVLLGSGVKLGLVALKAPLIFFAWALVADAALSGTALIWVFAVRGQKIAGWSWNTGVARLLLRDSWPLIISGVLVAIYLRIEQLLVMNLLGSYEMGIYYASVRVNEIWGFLPGMLLASLYPLMVQARERGRESYLSKVQLVFDAVTGMGYVVAIGITFLGSYIIPLIFGEEYRKAIPILMIQAWTSPVIFSAGARTQFFLLENLNVYHIWSALIGIVVNVNTALLLMPHLGARGAAFGALVGGWVSAYATSLLFKSLRECGRIQTRSFLLPFRLLSVIRRLKELK